MPLIEQRVGALERVYSHDHLFNANQLSKVFDAPDGIIRKAIKKSGIKTVRGYPNTVQVRVGDLPSFVPTLANSRGLGNGDFPLQAQIQGVDLGKGFKITTPLGTTIVFQPQV